MKKFGVFSITIFIAILLAGSYGIIHDQITYSICPEYFTKFKYQQFEIVPSMFGGDRQTVAVIGFFATWWMGLVIGIPIALIALFFPDQKTMVSAIFTAIGIVFFTAIIFGIIGFFRGKYYLVPHGVDWWFPFDLIHRDEFIIVGSIHNYSYLGGIAGLVIAIITMIRKAYVINTMRGFTS